MKNFFARWVITTIAVLAAAHLVPGIRYDDVGSLAVASLMLGLANAVLKPILLVLSLPLLFFTFGLFILVINSALFYFVSKLALGFHVADGMSAFWGSLVVSIVTFFLKGFQSTPLPRPPQGGGPFEGPAASRRDKVIDV